MKKTVLSLLFAINVLLIAFPAVGEPLKLSASAWPPYVDPETRDDGFAVALVSHALARAGYETEVAIEPWSQALEATVDGRYDVIVALWYREERAASLAFSEPYIDCEIALIKRAGSDFRFAGLESLVGQTVGVVDDYAYSRQAVDKTGIDVVAAGTVAESVAKLRAGEVDLVVADRRAALFHINEFALAKSFDVLPSALLSRGLRIAVPKSRPDHAAIIAAFEAAIAEMREDGSYDSILGTFRISTW